MFDLSTLWRATEKFSEMKRIYELLGPTIEEFKKVAPEVKQLTKQVRHHIFPDLFKEEIDNLNHIKALQELLQKRGYSGVVVDGEFGPRTWDALTNELE